MIELFANIAQRLGISRLVRYIRRNQVAVLLYHDPSPAVFEAHLEYLSKHYQLIPYALVVDALQQRSWSDVPKHSVVIHIDDGYLGNLELTEICAKYGVIPTLYLCSHVVGGRKRFWSKLSDGRSKQLRLVDNQLLLNKLESEADYTPDREFESGEALNVEQLSVMSGQFDYQSHGRYHFSMVTLDDDELGIELNSSRDEIQSITNQTCEHFSFPYGDYSDRELLAVKSAGFLTARTTRPGWIGEKTDPMQIPIVADIPGDASVNELSLQLTGMPRFFKRQIYFFVTQHIYAIRQRFLMSRPFF